MKKALFALAAICVCTSLQALTFTWTTKTNYDITSKNCDTGSLIYSEVGGDYKAAIAGLEGYTPISATPNRPPFKSADGSASAQVIFDSETDQYFTGTYFLVLTSTKTETHYCAVIKAGDIEWDTGVGSAPSSTPPIEVTFVEYVVPEPTVMALLALGVAGLALKRKHA